MYGIAKSVIRIHDQLYIVYLLNMKRNSISIKNCKYYKYD